MSFNFRILVRDLRSQLLDFQRRVVDRVLHRFHRVLEFRDWRGILDNWLKIIYIFGGELFLKVDYYGIHICQLSSLLINQLLLKVLYLVFKVSFLIDNSS